MARGSINNSNIPETAMENHIDSEDERYQINN